MTGDYFPNNLLVTYKQYNEIIDFFFTVGKKLAICTNLPTFICTTYQHFKFIYSYMKLST